MLRDLLAKTYQTKTGKAAFAGGVVSIISLSVTFVSDLTQTFELTEKQTERVVLIEEYFNNLSRAAVPLLFGAAYIFRGVSAKGFDGGRDDQETRENVRTLNTKMTETLAYLSGVHKSVVDQDSKDQVTQISLSQKEIQHQINQLTGLLKHSINPGATTVEDPWDAYHERTRERVENQEAYQQQQEQAAQEQTDPKQSQKHII